MYRFKILILLLGGAFYSANLAAQTGGDSSTADFEYVKHYTPWFESYNAAGLYMLPIEDISFAEAYFNKSDGKFINYSESNDSYKFGLNAESFYRLSSKVVLYGKIGYTNFEGKNMSGSAFINPDSNPFDIVEYDNNSAGKKQLEKYHLVGGISTDVYKGLRLGAKIDYLAANYAKMKDLRHQNHLLDMYLTMGLNYRINKMIEIGSNYFYRRSIESVYFEMYGNTDQQYYSLISFGAFYGRREVYDKSGYLYEKNSQPLFDEYHGGSFQLNISITSHIDFFNEFTFKSRDGYFGIKSSSDILHNEHNSKILEYKSIVSLKAEQSRHSIGLNIDREILENNENVYKRETQPGGGSNIVYYGKTKMLDKESLNARMEYTGNIGIKNYNPTWVLKAGAAFANRKETVSVYPYYRKQTINTTEVNLFANRNLFSGKSMYSISLGTAYGFGNGTAQKDGSYVTPSESQSEPANISKYLYAEYEYLTASHIKTNVSFRYTRPLNEKIRGYLELNYGATKGLGIEHLSGNTYSSFTLKVGCSF